MFAYTLFDQINMDKLPKIDTDKQPMFAYVQFDQINTDK